LRTVAIYAQEDGSPCTASKADEAYLVGRGKSPVAAYLDIKASWPWRRRRAWTPFIRATASGENAAFARACAGLASRLSG
jgi:pyruvate carboxylase